MPSFTECLFLTVTVLTFVYGGCGHEVNVHATDDGTLEICYKQQVWLRSGRPYLHTNGRRYSADNNTLKLVGISTTKGHDIHGPWVTKKWQYTAAGVPFWTSVKSYINVSMVILEQHFPSGANLTSIGAPDRALSGFPRFIIGGQTDGLDLGYLNYGGMFVGDTTKWIGRWSRMTYNIRDGVPGGPIALFDQRGNTAIISSYNNFMVNLQEHEQVFGGMLSYGIMGSVKAIPRGFTLQNIVYFGENGINQAFDGWGSVLRKQYGRHDDFVKSDFAVNYLGYWTDNGAYYYYQSEPNTTYEQTIYDVQAYARKVGIPYRYVQYDSWWYLMGPYGGVTEWVDRPGIFPHGMQYVYNKTGWPVVAHNRWWSSSTPYRKKYKFLTETLKAVPMDLNFWDDLLKQSKLWGLITYEQDWLDAQFLGLDGLLDNVYSARKWLMLMGRGAERADVTLQYCMSFPRHALQALEIPRVTQIRVTDDYAPGKDDWKLGVSSIIAHALRIAPYKDSFWTTSVQPGNPYDLTETYPALHAMASVLSTGPVGPADAIGKTNVSLLMRCCNADGLILKPDKPVTATDFQLKQVAFAGGPHIELWSTYSRVSGWGFGIIVGAAMSSSDSYIISPKDAGLDAIIPSTSKIFRALTIPPSRVEPFDDVHPLVVRGCSNSDFCLYHTVPVIRLSGQEVLLFGELSKWVPMSSQRVQAIELSSHDVTITLLGAERESVDFWYSLDGVTRSVRCVISKSGTVTLSVRYRTCK